MGNKHTQVQAESRGGDRLQVTAHETDSPIVPVAQLQELHSFRPDLVDWVKDQTEQEANFRRARQSKIDWYVFAERIGGLVAGALIAALGIGVAGFLAYIGQPIVAAVLGGGTLVSIVAILVTGQHRKGLANGQVANSPKKDRL